MSGVELRNLILKYHPLRTCAFSEAGEAAARTQGLTGGASREVHGPPQFLSIYHHMQI